MRPTAAEPITARVVLVSEITVAAASVLRRSSAPSLNKGRIAAPSGSDVRIDHHARADVMTSRNGLRQFCGAL